MPRPIAWTSLYLVVYSEQPRWMNSFSYAGRHVLSSSISPKGHYHTLHSTLQNIHPPYKLLNNDLTLTLWTTNKLRNWSRSNSTWFSANITVLVWGSWGRERGISLRFHFVHTVLETSRDLFELDTPWVLYRSFSFFSKFGAIFASDISTSASLDVPPGQALQPFSLARLDGLITAGASEIQSSWLDPAHFHPLPRAPRKQRNL